MASTNSFKSHIIQLKQQQTHVFFKNINNELKSNQNMKRKGRCYRNRRKRVIFDHVNHDDDDVSKAHPKDYHLYVLLQWLSRNDFHNVSNLSAFTFSDTGRGLTCKTKMIHDGDIIISIPDHLLIRHETAIKSISESIDENLSSIEILIAFMMCERRKGDSSYWYHYLNSLPTHFHQMPITWNNEIINQIKPDFLRDLILEEKGKFLKAREKVMSVIGICSSDQDVDEDVYDLFEWSWCVVNTRCIHVPSDTPNDIALAPFLDLLNHSSHVSIKTQFNRKTNCFQIISKTSYRRHEQVFINYGPHGNRELLIHYGFVIKDNPHHIIQLSSQQIHQQLKIIYNHLDYSIFHLSVHYRSQDLENRIKCLSKLGFIPDVFLISRDGFQSNLDLVLKLLCMTDWCLQDKDIKKVFYSGIANLNTLEFERFKEVKTRLIERLINEYSFHGTLNHDKYSSYCLLCEQEIEIYKSFPPS